ncbi:MAG: hypothetical protein IJS59_01795 [Bacteroidaceae bacterium]|nr:hypothetical protein [Bacteroidaceae bacterium]
MERPLRITLHLQPVTAEEVALATALRAAGVAKPVCASPKMSTLNAVRAAARAFRPL